MYYWAFVKFQENLKVPYCRKLFLLDLCLLQDRSGCYINAVKVSKLYRKVRSAQIQKVCLFTNNQNFLCYVLSLAMAAKTPAELLSSVYYLNLPRYGSATMPFRQFCGVATCCIASRNSPYGPELHSELLHKLPLSKNRL